MPLHKKLAFLGLFSLSLITVAIAIARVADIAATTLGENGAGFQFNPKFLWLWTAIEPCVGKYTHIARNSQVFDRHGLVSVLGLSLMIFETNSNCGLMPVCISSALLRLS